MHYYTEIQNTTLWSILNTRVWNDSLTKDIFLRKTLYVMVLLVCMENTSGQSFKANTTTNCWLLNNLQCNVQIFSMSTFHVLTVCHPMFQKLLHITTQSQFSEAWCKAVCWYCNTSHDISDIINYKHYNNDVITLFSIQLNCVNSSNIICCY